MAWQGFSNLAFKRSHLSLLLLGLSLLNPLCCCLGDALSAIPASPVTSKDSCCEGGTSIPDSKNIPNQDCPCECEAFVSHSWSDDGAAKFARLHSWAAGDASTLLWLDKACIDQANIEASLASLPIFLAGCQQLVVLAGASYAARLDRSPSVA